jgi:hypothetical protein
LLTAWPCDDSRSSLRAHIKLSNYCNVSTETSYRPYAYLLASCVALHACTKEEPAPAPAPPPAREEFHAVKPLRTLVSVPSETDKGAEQVAWLQRELNYLLRRGQMHVASGSAATGSAFLLSIELSADRSQASLKLIAPDQVLERQQQVALSPKVQLATVTALAHALPSFLDASHASGDWSAFIGTKDERAYESYVRTANELLGPSASGITRPVASRPRARAVERLEALTRAHREFARAWGALAIGYLSLGGDDLTSLTDLAESSAERALQLDENLPEAHTALAMVDLRNSDWIAAHEKFRWALSLDSNLAGALEGLACLHADAGHYGESLTYAMRVLTLQPRNAGASECLAYAQLGTAPEQAIPDALPASAARVRALAAVLQGERRTASRLLRGAMSGAEFDMWAAPMLRAAGNRQLVPDALKAITRAANDGFIDASTEILCGVALKQPEFVFNRISRLQRENVHAPLRMLWLPRADFLRQHSRFQETIGAAGLTAFWHSNGPPDVCETEPVVYGCNLKAERAIGSSVSAASQ